MHDTVAAIRASRSRARFVLPPAHRRERRLGLHRLFRTPGAGLLASAEEARDQPLKALRVAARGLIATRGESIGSSADALRREPRMRWSDDDRSPTRGATPWRS